jgi:hypothetical protein
MLNHSRGWTRSNQYINRNNSLSERIIREILAKSNKDTTLISDIKLIFDGTCTKWMGGQSSTKERGLSFRLKQVFNMILYKYISLCLIINQNGLTVTPR